MGRASLEAILWLSAFSLVATACAAHGGAPAAESFPQTPVPITSSSAPPAKTPATQPEADGDHDHLVGDGDMCPEYAEDHDGFEDDDGCPDPDNDKDKIPDTQDPCPNEPETYNGWQDEGCPDKG